MVVSHRYSDIESFTHLVKDWDLHLQQFSKNEVQGTLHQAMGTHLSLGTTTYSGDVIQQGAAPVHGWTFAFPETNIIWRKKLQGFNKVLVYGPGSEVDAITKNGFKVTVITFYLHQIEAFPLLESFITNAGKKPFESFEISNSHWQSFVATTEQVMQQVHDAGVLSLKNENWIYQSFVQHILQQQIKKERNGVLSTSVFKILEQINNGEGIQEFKVSELELIAKKGQRALQYDFKKTLGQSPKTFLKYYRLSKLRKALLTAPAHHKVTDIAYDLGYWHIGQLAKDYFSTYGELPSATLSR